MNNSILLSQKSFVLRDYLKIFLGSWHWKLLPKNLWVLQTYFKIFFSDLSHIWTKLDQFYCSFLPIWTSFSCSELALRRSSTQREVTACCLNVIMEKRNLDYLQSAAILSIIYCWKHTYSTNLLWTNAITTFLSVCLPASVSFAQKDSLSPLISSYSYRKLIFVILWLISDIKLNNKQATHSITIPSAGSIHLCGLTHADKLKQKSTTPERLVLMWMGFALYVGQFTEYC